MNELKLTEKEKYICYCQRITYEAFLEAVNQDQTNDFKLICHKLKFNRSCT